MPCLKIGIINTNENIYLTHKPKTVLLKNWWNSCSWHKNYSIVSTFEEKFFIKPKEYTNEEINKKYYWKPGINLHTFSSLDGIYPEKKHIRKKILEIFNPLTHRDFGIANVIIQGKTLKAIDYSDTDYGANTNSRLKFAIEDQLKMKYK